MVDNMKNGNNKKIVIVLNIIFILTFVIISLGASFAYFSYQMDGTPNPITVEMAEVGTATAEGTSVNLFVSSKDMQVNNASNDYTAYKEPVGTSNITIEASTGSTKGIDCTYDIVYNPTSVYQRSVQNVSSLKEFTISGYVEPISSSSFTVSNGTMPEVDLTGVDAPITLVSGAKLVVNGSNRVGTIVWYIKPRYYNLNISQSDNADKQFGGTMEVIRLACLPIN